MSASTVCIRTQPKPNCPLCGTAGQQLYEGLRDRLFGAPGEWRLVRCPREDCALVWPDPEPIPEDLPLAYRMYYTHETRGGALGKLYPLLATGYYAARFVPALVTGLHTERERIRDMFLGDLPPGRVFDVGCGDGAFLHRMQLKGWRGGGIDFDEAAVVAGKERYGLDLLAGDFLSMPVREKDFDAVTLSHVIEHVPDPVGCLRKCGELLRPGGRLVITTPNSRSLGHRLLGPSWRGLEPPRHLQIFSPSSLAECARRAGFEVTRHGSSAANADYIIAASHAIRGSDGSAPIGGGWKLSTALPGVLGQLKEHFALKHDPEAGEESLVIARRPLS